MELGEQLTNLKLDQTFLKELNEEDIEFAQKQFRKLYAQQMSKISYKMEKIERVKKHLIDIESQQSMKQKQIKQNLDKKCEAKQKNKDKYMSEKLKSYKIHQELWENKLQNIKRKHKQQMRQNCEQLKKYKNQIDNFWKTKTQQIANLANRRKQYQARCQSFNRKHRNTEQQHKMKTQQYDSNVVIPEIKRENTKNLQQDNNEKLIGKINHHSQHKTIRFQTQSYHEHRSSHHTNARKNDSHFTNKPSILSNRDNRDSNRGTRDSKHALLMPQMDQNKFSENLHVDKSKQRPFSQYHSQFPKFEQTKKYNKKHEDDEKGNISFQKAMKKLDKIQKLKQKNLKKSQQKDIILSPCQPRKSIDAEEYRLLRAKSQAKKQSKKHHTQQNAEANQRLQFQKNTAKLIVRNQTAVKQSQHRKLHGINHSRLSVSQTLQKQQHMQSKQRQNIEESRHIRWKKDKILRAIRDKVFKIKLQEIQKLNKSKF